MISAKEARERVKTALDARIKKEMKEVEAYVENAIGNHEFMCSVPYEVSVEAKNWLEGLGYTVEIQTNTQPHNEYKWTEIRW